MHACTLVLVYPYLLEYAMHPATEGLDLSVPTETQVRQRHTVHCTVVRGAAHIETKQQ